MLFAAETIFLVTYAYFCWHFRYALIRVAFEYAAIILPGISTYDEYDHGIAHYYYESVYDRHKIPLRLGSSDCECIDCQMYCGMDDYRLDLESQYIEPILL